jgi:hypothetical protein
MSLLDDLGFRPARIGIAIILLLLGVTAFNTWRNARMKALAQSVMGTKADVSTVKRLASYRGQQSAELLSLVVAGSKNQENRLAALQALLDRKDAAHISQLSELMLPTETLSVRQALANAIYQTGCTVECIRNMLYFEERMWRGDRPAEETAVNPPAKPSEKELELQTSIDEILRKNKPALGAVLEKFYGLAPLFPNPFAVETVSRLGITEACPVLMRTYLTVSEDVKASPEYKNVVAAVDKLGCEGRPLPSQP